MSRLKLKQDTTMRRIGDALLKMSSEVYRDPTKPFSSSQAQASEDEFKELFEGDIRIERNMARGDMGDGEPEARKGVVLRFHYDRTYDVDGETMHLVNVQVPDLYGKSLLKRVERHEINKETDPKKFDLDDFAAEALGMITILSCGS